MLGTTVDTYPYNLFGMRSEQLEKYSSYGRQKLRQPSLRTHLLFDTQCLFKAQSEPPSWDAEKSSHFNGFGMFWAIRGYPFWSLSPFSTNVGLVPNKIRLFSGTFVEKMMMNNCCLDHLSRWEFPFSMEVLVATSCIQMMDCPLPHFIWWPEGTLHFHIPHR